MNLTRETLMVVAMAVERDLFHAIEFLGTLKIHIFVSG